jgi:hypothetical protein
MMHNILGTEEIHRKHNNVTQQLQHLPINNAQHSNNQVQSTEKGNFFITELESNKSKIHK